MHVAGCDAYTMVVVRCYTMVEPGEQKVGSEEHEDGKRKTGGWPGFDDRERFRVSESSQSGPSAAPLPIFLPHYVMCLIIKGSESSS